MFTTSKRALIFSLSYFPMIGGAEVAVREITDRVKDIEWDLVTLKFEKSHPKFERIGNINVYRIGGGFGYLSKIIFVLQAAIFAQRRQYDFYWSIMTYMLFPAVLARQAPYILTLQDGDPVAHVFNRWFILPFRPFLSHGFKHATKIQAISNYLAKWARRNDVVVIPNGVDLEKFTVKHRMFDNTLITTSRLVEKNGIGDLIAAMKYLPENVKLKILGTGPLEQELKLKAKSLKLEARVQFLGHVPHEELPKYLGEADIFIRPSLSEGMGNSFIEAMAASLPVIATPVGGITDFLKDGETGLFCKSRDPESIALAVKKLIDDENLRKRIIENAQKMVREKYDWNLIAEQMKNLVFKPFL